MSNDPFHRVRHNLHLIPEHMHEGLMNYLEHGIEPGSFLDAVLRNKLVEAFACADHINLAAMFGWATLMHRFVPITARGEHVDQWMEDRAKERSDAR